jgi:hypothetical protein
MQNALEKAQDKELQALQNLAMMGVQYKTQAQQNLAQAQTQMGQLKDVQWQTNVMQPWEIQKNIETEQRQAGMQNLFGGLGEMGSTIMNFVGTKYYTDMLKDLYGQNNTPINLLGRQSPPMSQPFYSPQRNLLESTRKLMQGIPLTYKYPR